MKLKEKKMIFASCCNFHSHNMKINLFELSKQNLPNIMKIIHYRNSEQKVNGYCSVNLIKLLLFISSFSSSSSASFFFFQNSIRKANISSQH